jgi:signal recognition particle subunit SRP54
LPLTGVVLTKVDGDARGGAALSVRHVTGKPIKFIGVGEKLDKLEVFHPDRIAARILGQGDVLTLIEETVQKVDHDKAAELAQKVRKGKGFDFNDFRDQMLQMQKMGSIESMLEKLPGGQKLQAQIKNVNAEREMKRAIAIINSMTPQERRFPDLIKASRKRRIAAGSGTKVEEVNRLVKMHRQMADMMKAVGKKRGIFSQMFGGGPPPEMPVELPQAASLPPGGLPPLPPGTLPGLGGGLPRGLPGLPGLPRGLPGLPGSKKR